MLCIQKMLYYWSMKSEDVFNQVQDEKPEEAASHKQVAHTCDMTLLLFAVLISPDLHFSGDGLAKCI